MHATLLTYGHSLHYMFRTEQRCDQFNIVGLKREFLCYLSISSNCNIAKAKAKSLSIYLSIGLSDRCAEAPRQEKQEKSKNEKQEERLKS